MKSMKGQFSNEKLAKKYGTTERGIRRWRTDGCPFGRGESAVWEWLSTRRSLPKRTSELLLAWAGRQVAELPPILAAQTTSGEVGAVAALSRWERIENALGRLVEGAIPTGDVSRTTALAALHESASKELRHYDKIITPGRRLGDVTPTADAQAILQSFYWHLRNNMRDGVLHATTRLLPSEHGSTVTPILASVLDSYLLVVASTLAGCGLVNGQPLPAWAKSALEKQLGNQFPKTDLGEQGRMISDIVKEVTAVQAEAVVKHRAEREAK